MMDSLNDGHHSWVSCYDSLFPTRHSIPIVSFSPSPSSTKPDVYIAPDVEAFISQNQFTDIYNGFGIRGADIAGAQVLSIDGKDVWDHLEQDILPYTSVYTDKQQRMNSLFASYTAGGGAFGRTAGRFTVTGDLTRNNMTMVLKTTKGEQREMVVPWITLWQSEEKWKYPTGQALYVLHISFAYP